TLTSSSCASARTTPCSRRGSTSTCASSSPTSRWPAARRPPRRRQRHGCAATPSSRRRPSASGNSTFAAAGSPPTGPSTRSGAVTRWTLAPGAGPERRPGPNPGGAALRYCGRQSPPKWRAHLRPLLQEPAQVPEARPEVLSRVGILRFMLYRYRPGVSAPPEDARALSDRDDAGAQPAGLVAHVDQLEAGLLR